MWCDMVWCGSGGGGGMARVVCSFRAGGCRCVSSRVFFCYDYFACVSWSLKTLSTGRVRVVPGYGVPGVPEEGAEAAERPLLPGGGVSSR